MPLFSPIVASGQNIGWSDVPLVRGAANTLSLENSANAMALWVHGTTDSTRSNYRRLRLSMTTGGAATIAVEGLGTGVSGNTLVFTVNGSTAISIPASLNVTFGANIYAPAGNVFGWVNRNALSAPADAVYLFQNSAGTEADIFLKLGVNTSAAAGIKRVGTQLQARLNDDTGYAFLLGKLQTNTNYTAGTFTPTGYLTMYDLAGTAYRVPCIV